MARGLANYETDAALLASDDDVTLSNYAVKVIESIPVIEQVMDWYDHVACTFLLYDEPLLACQKIKAIIANYKKGADGISWRHLAISPYFQHSPPDCKEKNALKLFEILKLLQQHKVLKMLGSPVNFESQVNTFYYCMFKVIDSISKDDSTKLIENMNLKIAAPNYTHNCLELHFLEWIVKGEISSLNTPKLDVCLLQLKVEPLFSVAKSSCPSSVIDISTNQSHSSTCQSSLPLIPQRKTSGSLKFKVSHGLCIIINQMNFYIDRSLPPEMLKV